MIRTQYLSQYLARMAEMSKPVMSLNTGDLRFEVKWLKKGASQLTGPVRTRNYKVPSHECFQPVEKRHREPDSRP
jgi:hypothetical protein